MDGRTEGWTDRRMDHGYGKEGGRQEERQGYLLEGVALLDCRGCLSKCKIHQAIHQEGKIMGRLEHSGMGGSCPQAEFFLF